MPPRAIWVNEPSICSYRLRLAWSEAILTKLGAPLTDANIISLGYWMQNEAGSGLSSSALGPEFSVYSGGGYTAVPDSWGASQGKPQT